MDSTFLKTDQTSDPIKANGHLKLFLKKIIKFFLFFQKGQKKLKGHDRSKNLPEI